jgi:hypothetical protein
MPACARSDIFGGRNFLNDALGSASSHNQPSSQTPTAASSATTSQLAPLNPLCPAVHAGQTARPTRAIGNLQARVNAPFLRGLSVHVPGSFDGRAPTRRRSYPTTDPPHAFQIDTPLGTNFQNLPERTTAS